MLGREHASIGQLGLLCGLTLFTAMSAACGGDDAPTTIAECETAQCRQTLVLETWPEDQDKAQSMIEALPAKLEQEAAISKLLDAYLGEVDALCPKYASEYTQDRCGRIRDRPHLFSSLPPPRSTVGRLGSGPANSRLYPSVFRDSPYREIEPDPGPCVDDSDVNGCLWKRAELKAQEGEVM